MMAFRLFLIWLLGFLVFAGAAAAGLVGDPRVWRDVLSRFPQLLTGSVTGWPLTGGFVANVFISVVSMAIATVLGVLLCVALLARSRAISLPALLVMNFFRNSPWLVLLFATLYLLPFKMRFLGITVEFPPIAKAIFGLSLPIAANFAEVVRGAVQSIHAGQWESARSLGYGTWQIYRHVVLPQAFRRMIPGWMNLYALVTLGTALASVTGVQEVLATLRAVLAVEPERSIAYFYFAVFFLFLVYCYPIARLSRRLERAAKGDAI